MAAIKRWGLGKHITAVKITAQSIAADGTLSDAAGGSDVAELVLSTGALHSTLAFSLGILEDIEFDDEDLGENISPANRTRSHNVPTVRSTGFTVREIQRNGAGLCRLAALAVNGASDIVKCVYARFGERFTVYGTILSYDEDLQPGKNVGTLVCGPVDAGVDPAMATADR